MKSVSHTKTIFIWDKVFKNGPCKNSPKKSEKNKNFTRDQRQDVFIDKKPKQTQKHKDIM